MLLAHGGKEIPSQWEHDPALQDIDGQTVAMILSCDGKKVPI